MGPICRALCPPPYLVQDPGQAVKQHLQEEPLGEEPLGGAQLQGEGALGPPPLCCVGTARLHLEGGVGNSQTHCRLWGERPPKEAMG